MQQISKMSFAVFLSAASFLVFQAAAFAPLHATVKLTNTRLNAASLSAPITIAEGLSKQIISNGDGPQLRLGEVATISYTCTTASDNKTFSKSNKQKVVVGDGIMIEGWDLALASMSVGEKATIRIDDAERFGYGAQGIEGFVPPMAKLQIEMEVLEAEEQKNMGVAGVVGAGAIATGLTGSGDLGALDPSKPRTPAAIKQAYAMRQGQIAEDKANEKEGLEGMIEKAKEFYFFGFFEGETGEKAPWILRPSITFPIAFAVVGVGFYVTFALGGISERGRQVTDELDDIILSMEVVKNALVVAFANMNM